QPVVVLVVVWTMGLPSWFVLGMLWDRLWRRWGGLWTVRGEDVSLSDTGGTTEQMSGRPVDKAGSLSTRQCLLSTLPSLPKAAAGGLSRGGQSAYSSSRTAPTSRRKSSFSAIARSIFSQP